MKVTQFACLLLLHLSWELRKVEALRNVRLQVPTAVRQGTSVKLVCHYDLEGAQLYKVQWYKGTNEFYRYVPKEATQTKVFPVAGIQVDLTRSNSNEVMLRNVPLSLSGQFSCEVSVEGPPFSTRLKSENITVVEYRDTKPVVKVDRIKYEVGHRMNANCTLANTMPAANLTFLINDKPVSDSYVRRPIKWTDESGLENVILTLDYNLSSRDFRGGRLGLKCLASIYSIYREFSREITIEESGPRLASVLGTRESPSANSSSLSQIMNCLLLAPSFLLLSACFVWRR